MKYTKKPVTVDVVQFTGENTEEIKEFVGDKLLIEKDGLYIKTLEGKMHIGVNDYVIKGIQGEFYPCKPDIFAETYADADTMSIAECREATRDHIEMVRKYLKVFTDELTLRGINHDASKNESPEVEIFAKETKKLARLKFTNENGEVSEEYKNSLANLQEALAHHYANNGHHPEHYKNGISDMNLIDIVEMLCDWKAASLRQNNGNLRTSLEANAKRYGIKDELYSILENTVDFIDEK